MSKRTKIRLVKYISCLVFVLVLAGSYVLGQHSTQFREAYGASLEFKTALGDMTFFEKTRLWFQFFFEKTRLWFQFFKTHSLVEWYRWISDGLTLPSVTLLSAGLLIWVSNAGALDLLGYSGRFMMQLFLPASKKRYGTYGDYVAEKQEKRIKGYGFLLISGAISLAVTFVFIALFFTVY